MIHATIMAPAVLGGLRTHVQALSSCQRLALHRRYICSFKALVSHKLRHTQQKLNAASEPDSALQRIVSSPRGKPGSAALNRLSKPELQQELRSRGLSDRGLKDELKTRLLDSLDVDASATDLASEPPHATEQPGSSSARLTNNTQEAAQLEGTGVTEEERMTAEESMAREKYHRNRTNMFDPDLESPAFKELDKESPEALTAARAMLHDEKAAAAAAQASIAAPAAQAHAAAAHPAAPAPAPQAPTAAAAAPQALTAAAAPAAAQAITAAAAAAAQAPTATAALAPAAQAPTPAAVSAAAQAPTVTATSAPAAAHAPIAAAAVQAPIAAAAVQAPTTAAAAILSTASAGAPSAPTPATNSARSPAGSSAAGVTPSMSVTWLGTSSGAPSLRRNVSCMALTFGRDTYLVDCGEGSGKQVLRAKINPRSIKGIFISHLHGDHCFGLPGLIEMISQSRADDSEAEADPKGVAFRQPLRVFGPPGIQQLVKAAMLAGKTRLSMPLLVTDFTLEPQQARAPTPVDPSGLISFARLAPQQSGVQQGPARRNPQSQNRHRGQQAKLQAHDVPVVPGLTWTMKCDNGLTVRAAQLQHRLPCWGYVIEEARRQQLPGRKVVLLGDTCESEAIAGLGMGADLLAHEATFAAGMENKAHKAQHSTAPMAGEFARKIRANALVLTHFSNRYSSRGPKDEVNGDSDNDHKDVLQQLISQARGAFGKDRVWAAYDFYTFDIRHKHRKKPSTF